MTQAAEAVPQVRTYTVEERVPKIEDGGAVANGVTSDGPWHPRWCHWRWCTAWVGDWRHDDFALHRSQPYLLWAADDPSVPYYVFVEACSDGDDPEIRIVQHDPSYAGSWWLPAQTLVDVRLPVLDATRINRAMTELLADVAAEAEGRR